jgi:hypothetical protein
VAGVVSLLKRELECLKMKVLCYGGGTNTTAMIVGLAARNIRPDLIIMADTGAERPHTYAHIEIMQTYLKKIGYPQITIVKKVDKNGDIYTLEQDLLDHKCLPSVAYGFKTCSQKYKTQPVDKFLNNHPDAIAAWKRGEKITKLIGFDADEPHRVKDYDDKKYEVKYPLIEWDWGRNECIDAIKSAGLPLPKKSSCFFCPNMRPHEIMELNALYPHLAERALKMEANAELTTIKGLGRRFAWSDLLRQTSMFNDMYESSMPCGCYDGD